MRKAKTEEKHSKPSVFEFLNYRKFLDAHYRYKKASQASFSYNVFGRRAGMKSRTYMQMIIQGTRNLTPEMASGVAAACDLTENEIRYFLSLVRINQATDVRERDLYWKDLMEAIPEDGIHLLKDKRIKVLQKWYYLVLKELTTLKDFVYDPEWLSKRLLPELSTFEIKEAIEFLKRAGMIQKKGSRYEPQEAAIFLEGRDLSELIKEYHKAMIPVGIEVMLKVPAHSREYLATTFSVREEDIENFKRDIKALQKKVLAYASKVKNADEIYQLNVQFFPLTRKVEKEE